MIKLKDFIKSVSDNTQIELTEEGKAIPDFVEKNLQTSLDEQYILKITSLKENSVLVDLLPLEVVNVSALIAKLTSLHDEGITVLTDSAIKAIVKGLKNDN